MLYLIIIFVIIISFVRARRRVKNLVTSKGKAVLITGLKFNFISNKL